MTQENVFSDHWADESDRKITGGREYAALEALEPVGLRE
jgi:hypothetical protein